VLASTFIQVDFLFKSSIDTWAPDNSGHKDYIQYLVKNFYVPPEPSGWQRQQPFLYYEWCAFAFNIGKVLGLNDQWFAVRVASRILYLGYIIFSILLIERFRFPALAKLGALSAVLFWPCAYLVSTRTNNDLGFMFFFMASLWFLQLWHETMLKKNLCTAIVFAALSFLCKGTGIISLATFIAVILCNMASRKITLRYFLDKSFLFPAVIVTVCLSAYFGRLGYYILFNHSTLNWFANVQLGDVPYTPATLYHLVYFNLIDFVQNPVFSWDVANKNIYTFWDFFFRTLLFYPDIDKPKNILKIISILWVVLLIMCICKISNCLRSTQQFKEHAVVLIAGFLMIVILMIQRCITPDRYLANGRYIYPITVIFSIFIAGLLKKFYTEKNHTLYYLSFAFFIAFSLSSNLLTIYNNFP
jgi:hypothetical protein